MTPCIEIVSHKGKAIALSVISRLTEIMRSYDLATQGLCKLTVGHSMMHRRSPFICYSLVIGKRLIFT